MPKTVFLDTNIFLHYQPFDKIDWLKILEVDSIVIVVPPVILRELNQQKELHPKSNIRKRADTVIKKLLKLYESTSPVYIREGVCIQFEDRDPTISFSDYKLNDKIQDDNLIASIVMYKNEISASDILLITADDGLTLMTKAKRQGIAAKNLPDKFRIPYAPDPLKKQNEQLIRENNELKRRVPQLSLTFENGDQHATFVLHKPLDIKEDELATKLNEIRNLYPNIEENPEHAKDIPETLATIGTLVKNMKDLFGNTLNPEDIDEYNRELNDFYKVYDEYLRKEISYENLKRRTIKLSLWITNKGTAPAEDIDVLMFFPDGFKLLDESKYPEPPTPPQPPSKPLTTMQKLSNISGLPYVALAPFHSNIPDIIESTLPALNVSSPNIKHRNSYDVDFHVKKVKHNLPEKVKSMCVALESFDHARSFHIDYNMLADNVPNEVTGQLHVIIQKQ